MIHEIDEALEALVRADALGPSGAEVVFDAPTKDWAARRNTPTVDLYLYDIREDTRRRHVGSLGDRDDEGVLRAIGEPPRYFRLAYLVTAWTQRPEDEHRLPAAMLSAFLRNKVVPKEHLRGTLAELAMPVLLEVAKPLPENRQVSEVWSSLDSDLKASLEVSVTAPMTTAPVAVTAPPASAGTVVRMFGEEGQDDETSAARGSRAAGSEVADETGGSLHPSR